MNTPTLYVTVLLIMCLASAVTICWRLLRRGLDEDYLSVATLVGLIVFVVIAVGGPFLYAYEREVPLVGLAAIAFLSAFVGMALALLIGWGIVSLGRADRSAPGSRE